MKGIQKIEADREARRAKAKEDQLAKKLRAEENAAQGRNKTDVDFDLLIEEQKSQVGPALNHISSAEMGICINVRKRPLFDKEYQNGEIDAVSASNPKVVVHQPMYKVDGITKYVKDSNFKFDNTFNENENSQVMYQYALKDILPTLFDGGIITVFAYG